MSDGMELKVETLGNMVREIEHGEQKAMRSKLDSAKTEFKQEKKLCVDGMSDRCDIADEKWAAIVRLTNLIHGVK